MDHLDCSDAQFTSPYLCALYPHGRAKVKPTELIYLNVALFCNFVDALDTHPLPQSKFD